MYGNNSRYYEHPLIQFYEQKINPPAETKKKCMETTPDITNTRLFSFTNRR